MGTLRMRDEKTGMIRDPTPDEVSALIDDGEILNEGGADLLTRTLVKWFSSNDAEAKAFLERRGFQVLEVGDKDRKLGKVQFAIRNPALDAILGPENNKAKVLDPRGFDFGDVADIAFDLFISAPLTTAAAGIGVAAGAPTGPGAVVTGLAARGLASAGVEAGRQEVGKLLGVNESLDKGNIAMAGVAGALLPQVLKLASRFPRPLLAGAKLAAKKLESLGINLSAITAGTSEDLMRLGTATRERAAAIIKEKAPQAIEILDSLRGKIASLRDLTNKFTETREMEQILDKSGGPVPLGPVMSALRRGGNIVTTEDQAAVKATRRIADNIAHGFGFKDAVEATTGRVGQAGERYAGEISSKEAFALRQILNKKIKWEGAAGEAVRNKILKDAQKVLNKGIVRAITSEEARAQYVRLNGFGSKTTPDGVFRFGKGLVGKMEAINEIDRRIGQGAKKAGAERFLQGVTAQGRTQQKRLVEQFDKLFGTDYVEQGLQSRLGEKFSQDVLGLTALGKPRGMQIGAAVGGVLGGMTGDLKTAASSAGLGAAAGLTIGPKTMIRVGRGFVRGREGMEALDRVGGRFLSRIQPLTDYLATTGGFAAVPQISRVATDSEPVTEE